MPSKTSACFFTYGKTETKLVIKLIVFSYPNTNIASFLIKSFAVTDDSLVAQHVIKVTNFTTTFTIQRFSTYLF